VQVHVGILGQLVADDHRQLGDVQSARGEVGRHQHAGAAIAEQHQHLVALALLQVAVQGHHREAPLREARRHLLHVAPGLAEHQHGFGPMATQQHTQRIELAGKIDLEELLRDLRLRLGGINGDRQRLTLEAATHRTNFLGVGRGEQQRLPRHRCPIDDLSDRIDEAHVEHAIGLVQHQHPKRVEMQAALAQMLLHTSRRADHDLGVVFERGQLRAQRDAAREREQLHVRQQPREPADLLGDLIGELTGRAEHQRLHALQRRLDARQQRKAEGCGLAAAGARLRNDITAVEHRRQRLRLHRRHACVAQQDRGLHELRTQRQAGQRAAHPASRRSMISLANPWPLRSR
jgi:hypothetical protein